MKTPVEKLFCINCNNEFCKWHDGDCIFQQPKCCWGIYAGAPVLLEACKAVIKDIPKLDGTYHDQEAAIKSLEAHLLVRDAVYRTEK